MSRIAHFAFILLFCLTVSQSANAENKSAPNISLAQINADGMIADLKYLVLDLAEEKKGWSNLEELLPSFLEGIDKTRPLRIDILLGENQKERYRLILPISNLAEFAITSKSLKSLPKNREMVPIFWGICSKAS